MQHGLPLLPLTRWVGALVLRPFALRARPGSSLRAAALLAGLAVLTACGGRAPAPAPPAPPPYPFTLRPPSETPGDFVLEQVVEVTHPEGTDRFQAVLQKQGDELLLLGLAPHGGRAFALRQVGTEISFERFVPVELPFPPEYVLYDVHRTWLLPMDASAPERRYVRDGEEVSERYSEGLLASRTFTREDGSPPGTITVVYEGGLDPRAPAGAAPPPRARFENGWFGYALTIETTRWTPLGAATP